MRGGRTFATFWTYTLWWCPVVRWQPLEIPMPNTVNEWRQNYRSLLQKSSIKETIFPNQWVSRAPEHSQTRYLSNYSNYKQKSKSKTCVEEYLHPVQMETIQLFQATCQQTQVSQKSFSTTARSVQDETRNAELNGNPNPEWWEDFSQLKFKLNKNLNLNLYHKIPRNSNPIKISSRLCSVRYREIWFSRFWLVD